MYRELKPFRQALSAELKATSPRRAGGRPGAPAPDLSGPFDDVHGVTWLTRRSP